MGDTPKDFAILQSPKCSKFSGKKLKSYHSADAKKGNVLVYKGASSNMTSEDFKELLDFNKNYPRRGRKNEVKKNR